MTKGDKLTKVLPYLLVLPAFLLIAVFKIFPILDTVKDSFMYQGELGLGNYTLLFEDSMFWNSLWVTFKFNIITTPLQIILAIALAMLVNTDVKGIGFFRTIYYLPVTISLTVGTILWSLMFNPNSGIINSFLGVLGIEPQGFLVDSNQALWCIMIIATWKGVAYWMMFILAGLKNIDSAIYEAAKIDGAGWWQTTRSITLPLLNKVLTFVIVADTTSNLLLFAPMHMVTKGGPQMSTNVLMYEAYKSSFMFVDRGRSAAIVTILLLITIGICATQFIFMNPDKKKKSIK